MAAHIPLLTSLSARRLELAMQSVASFGACCKTSSSCNIVGVCRLLPTPGVSKKRLFQSEHKAPLCGKASRVSHSLPEPIGRAAKRACTLSRQQPSAEQLGFPGGSPAIVRHDESPPPPIKLIAPPVVSVWTACMRKGRKALVHVADVYTHPCSIPHGEKGGSCHTKYLKYYGPSIPMHYPSHDHLLFDEGGMKKVSPLFLLLSEKLQTPRYSGFTKTK